MMSEVLSLEDVLAKEKVVLLFGSRACSVCTALDQQIRPWMESRFSDVPYYKIYLEDHPDFRAHFLAFSVPVLLMLNKGREQYRKAGVFSLQLSLVQLEDLLQY